jgi:DNA-binding XRE family transcriptional regulator
MQTGARIGEAVMNPQSVSLAQRLSGDAHQRIRDAHDEADLILLRAIGSIHIQYEGEHGLLASELEIVDSVKTAADSEKLETLFAGRRFVRFDDYCARGSPAVQLSEARLQAARIVLQAIAREFAHVGTGIECWKAMPHELRGVAREYKLTEIQKQIVWGELKKNPGFPGITKPAANSSAVKRGRATREWEIDGDKLRKLREEHDYSQVLFCRPAGLSIDSLGRIESGKPVRQSTAAKAIRRCVSLKWIATAKDLKK